MRKINRREFLASAAIPLAAAAPIKKRIGLVQSTHRALQRPASPDDPLDYERVRDMVWKAIEYSGGLEGRIRPGAWVVVKPNIVFLRPQSGYCGGDITDLRVTRAVVEYVARHSAAARVTIAEGGSYRGLRDSAADNAVTQDGRRADAATFDWGPREFPGFAGSLGGMLGDFAGAFADKKFDYVDLCYDAVRDAAGALRRITVPQTARGVGAFGGRPDYHVTNTIRQCDFLISVPVMKVHEQCGITGCLKNYVGTAPREAYSIPGSFWNARLHDQHGAEDRIDGFITDLASFHPPDFNVVDGIRGLQYTEHANHRPGQMLRNNLVFAGQDPVACDALAAYLMGFNPWDIDFLHMAEQREMGRKDLDRADVAGDDPSRLQSRWSKPKDWYGRCNREWLVDGKRQIIPGDTLRFPPGDSERTVSVRVIAAGSGKAYLWVGVRGRVIARLNGEKVLEEENLTRYRVGQFQQPMELRSGENRLDFRVRPSAGQAQLSVLLTGPRNDGDTPEGLRWSA